MSGPVGPVAPAFVAGVVGYLGFACDRCPKPATLAMASVTCPGCTLRMSALLCDTCYFWMVRDNPGIVRDVSTCCDTCGRHIARSMIGSVDFIINL